MISANTVTEIAEKEGIGWAIVEKDYFLTLLLEGISQTPFLKENLVFKGGTALRKIYFEHYRYSEDLDFTLTRALSESEVRTGLESAFAYLKTEHNADFKTKDLRARNWFTDAKIQFTGLKDWKNTVTLDLMADESIIDAAGERKVFNPYYEKTFRVRAYSLEEITAEKLRSLLQRTRVRDYYDAWFILTRAKKLDGKKVVKIFAEKLAVKKLSFPPKGRLLDERKIAEAKAYYESQLGNQIKPLPAFDALAQELRNAVSELGL